MRNRVVSAIASSWSAVLVVWVVYRKLSAKGQLTAAKWEPFLTGNLWKTYVLPGIQGTLTAAAISIVLARDSGLPAGRGPADAESRPCGACAR